MEISKYSGCVERRLSKLSEWKWAGSVSVFCQCLHVVVLGTWGKKSSVEIVFGTSEI